MIVSKNDDGDFDTIQKAVDSVSKNNKKRVIIKVKAGVYKEKLSIRKPFISLIGEDVSSTVITFNDSANTLMANKERMRTFNSYTMFVDGDDFICENITVENNAGDGDLVGQAVAVYADGDRMIFRNCRLLANQDTLFTGPLPPKPIEGNNFGGPKDGMKRRDVRQYYENCYIRGDIDFIFGSATAVFNKCEIFSNDKNKEVNGFIAAASTPEGKEFGYVFLDCKFISDARKHTVYLGRPWRDYAKTVFIRCFMGEHIIPEGFHNWNKANAEKESYYAEYKSYGPGAANDKRVKWAKLLNDKEVEKYSITNILKGNDDWKVI
ncbi:pectinesterase [Clostridium acetobutylicum]|uniref:Pectinesterase n=1 Tax=Clostridium acetobutylicum (strain ATCC 824 / DSM 792 / JCM 1419 / IAM 19013 / LMG 5710 / NBRC 13948 / NRRL B-527 / VKM B-1787 / 2291 / W) TaxID=272562 RepID=Q97DU8_CLOAB|nr:MULTISPECIES: pectinesterase family protein [Clostridium]AAK81304.1 Pectin methylesterase [Clostridium acetobutylicum ATCC 824]ADZ22413.1 Pectin methylesterase [Clostridium acetobutylicum EA 2018]AEI32806.1 pectin methylesterase [Clostridium acetobutylicum DSM 1731]AWV81030.1 pectin methylesterase [Clostridium acetobutylicum]MBC2395543.1 pectin methylesterase [Clostridium acetobutylicum]